jgi:EAL and modified HD-GYP domain-containing signal transduction protein
VTTHLPPSRSAVLPGIPSSYGAAFVGRQPILDHGLSTYGYELLYRAAGQDTATFLDGDSASAEVALNAYLEFGLDALAGDKRAFINVTRAVLLSGFCRQLPSDRVVLEVLENVPCDEAVVREVEGLAAEGYQIALDDYVARDARRPLIPFASLIKIDIEGASDACLRALTGELADSGLPLLAERVETQQDLARCEALGFTYFQGFFFARPATMRGRRVPVERLTALRVLTLLADPDTPLDLLARAVAADVKLSYQLLRAANSAARAPARPIDSIPGALTWIGRDQLRAWLSMLGLSGLHGKPPAVLTMALIRARMCERLAEHHQGAAPASWFMAGLFSALDLLFETPIERLLQELPVSRDVVDALVSRSGELGHALDAVLAFERGDWPATRYRRLNAGDFTVAYRSALEWVGQWEAQVG